MKKINKFFIWTLPLLFIIGSLSHFLYDWTGQNFLIGLICPVNESIFEHTKLAILPLGFFYIWLYLKNKENINKILLCFMISWFISVLFMPMLFYFYTGAFAIESILIDILIFFVSITLGQLISLHIYNRVDYVKNASIIIVILITYFILNIIFTINPPQLPIFLDPVTSTYGMNL